MSSKLYIFLWFPQRNPLCISVFFQSVPHILPTLTVLIRSFYYFTQLLLSLFCLQLWPLVVSSLRYSGKLCVSCFFTRVCRVFCACVHACVIFLIKLVTYMHVTFFTVLRLVPCLYFQCKICVETESPNGRFLCNTQNFIWQISISNFGWCDCYPGWDIL